MSAIDRILQTMHPKVIYRPEDVSQATGIDTDTCGKALRMLAKGGGSRSPGSGLSPQEGLPDQAEAVAIMRYCRFCKAQHPETEAFYRRVKITGKLAKGCHAYRRHRAAIRQAFLARRNCQHKAERLARQGLTADPLLRLAVSRAWV